MQRLKELVDSTHLTPSYKVACLILFGPLKFTLKFKLIKTY